MKRLPFTTDDVREQCAQFGDAPLAHPLPVRDLLKMCDRIDELELELRQTRLEKSWASHALENVNATLRTAEAHVNDLVRELAEVRAERDIYYDAVVVYEYRPDPATKARAEAAEAERDLAIHNGTAAQLRAEAAEAERDRLLLDWSTRGPGEHVCHDWKVRAEAAEVRIAAIVAHCESELALEPDNTRTIYRRDFAREVRALTGGAP